MNDGYYGDCTGPAAYEPSSDFLQSTGQGQTIDIVCSSVSLCSAVCVHVCVHVCVRVCVCTYICVYVCTYVCACVRACVCIFLYFVYSNVLVSAAGS